MATQKIIELRRTGGGILEATPVVFEWDSDTRTMMQGDLDYHLKVHTVRELPPNSEQPIEQVMGVSWEPFDIHGEWYDKWAGEGFANTTLIAFAQLIGRTPIVRFQIGQHSFVGLITDLKIRWRTEGEVMWAVTLSPHQNEMIGDYRRATFTVLKPSAQRVSELQLTQGTIEALSDNARALPTAKPDIASSLDNLVILDGALDDVAAAATAVASESNDGINAVADRSQYKLFALASAFRRLRGACDTIQATAGTLTAYEQIAYSDPIAMLRFEEWSRATMVETMRMVGAARAGDIDARTRASKNPKAIHRTKKGESLERISMRYYGTPNNWRVIYDANNLSSLALASGIDLIVPERLG